MIRGYIFALVVSLCCWMLACSGGDRRSVVDSGSPSDGGGTAGEGGAGDGGTASDGAVGSDGDVGSDGSAPSDNRARWAASCNARTAMMCGPVPGECMRTADCYDPWLEPDVFAAYIACFEMNGCAASDDSCVGAAIMGLTPGPEATAIDTLCRMRNEECGGFGGDGLCSAEFYEALQDSYLPAYMACLEGPCADVRTCFRATRPAACNGG